MTRFIPAYAGNSRRAYVTALPNAVHPRLRGELSVNLIAELRGGGSSPLTRGTPVGSPGYLPNSAVHPRLRGELLVFLTGWITDGGSSPLTRGTPLEPQTRPNRNRFIPAYAGNSNARACAAKALSVHPRLRGELKFLASHQENSVGSSPLTRGTLLDRRVISEIPRFIPAYAGNSLKDGINPSIHTLGI